MLFGRLEQAIDEVALITAQNPLLDHSPILQRILSLRAPYITPLNDLQISLPTRHRSDAKPDPLHSRILLLSINGIVAMLRNTG